MRISRKRIFFLLLLSLSTISFIRLLIITSTFSGHLHRHSLITTFSQDPLTPKEFNLIRSLISKRAPCNILFFGLGTRQHLELARLNRGGSSVFLEDDFARIREHRSERSDGVEMHSVEYKFKASEAYDLLHHARNVDDCRYDLLVGLIWCYIRIRTRYQRTSSSFWSWVSVIQWISHCIAMRSILANFSPKMKIGMDLTCKALNCQGTYGWSTIYTMLGRLNLEVSALLKIDLTCIISTCKSINYISTSPNVQYTL